MADNTQETQQQENQLSKYNNLMKESRAEKLRQRDLAIFKEVLAAKENEKMPEVVFKEYFADYFKNQGFKEDPTKLHQWLGISGGWYEEVDLVNEAGEVVDTVPGFYKRLDLVDSYNDVPLTDIVIRYNNKKDRLAVVGEEYARDALGAAERKIVSDEATNAHETRWNNIINKYATKDTPLPTSNPEKITPKVVEQLQLNMDDDD